MHASPDFNLPWARPVAAVLSVAALPAAILLIAVLFAGCQSAPNGAADESAPVTEADMDAVNTTLDEIHAQAARADYDAYFDLYSDQAVFLGTDATERWPIDAFKAYARPRFTDGGGWDYRVLERHVDFAPGGDVAWFDERLENVNMGETRGSGVLLRENGAWKVAQYNLTVLVPNELAREVVQRIREHQSAE